MRTVLVTILMVFIASAAQARLAVDLMRAGLIETTGAQVRTDSSIGLACSDNSLMFYGLFEPAPGTKYSLLLPSCVTDPGRGFLIQASVFVPDDTGSVQTTSARQRRSGVHISVQDAETGKVINHQPFVLCKTQRSISFRSFPRPVRIIITASSGTGNVVEIFGASPTLSKAQEICNAY